jgi:hypothetical protein
MDCTFALDCIHACPYDNVGIQTVVPGADLISDSPRSGIGRFSQRTDLAVMVLVVVFAAFLNAAEMISPVLELEDRLTAWMKLTSLTLSVTATTLVGLLVLPAIMVTAAAMASHRWGGAKEDALRIWRRFTYALVPLGFGMWLAHYSFHFFTSAGTLIPAVQRLARDLGVSWVGEPTWAACCAARTGNWLLVLQILVLDLGLIGSLYTAYRMAWDHRPGAAGALRLFTPWAAVVVLLFALGIWILFQPMQMRGTLMMPIGNME